MKKYLFFALFACALLFFFSAWQYYAFHDGKLHITFCDVGQGDGILIRTPNGKLALIDGGPDEKILGCLARHTPFWERSISLVLLSHPHADHLNGLIYVLDRYVTRYFGSEKLANKTTGFSTLHSVINEKHITEKVLSAGDSMQLSGGVRISVLSPTPELIQRTSPNGIVGESKEFANLILLVQYGSFRALLVGDSQAPQVEEAASHLTSGVDLLQVPHHGSMTGLSEKALLMLRPKRAVISVGKNTYGHPSRFTLQLLEKAHIPVQETLELGDIDITSNGKN